MPASQLKKPLARTIMTQLRSGGGPPTWQLSPSGYSDRSEPILPAKWAGPSPPACHRHEMTIPPRHSVVHDRGDGGTFGFDHAAAISAWTPDVAGQRHYFTAQMAFG